MQTCRRREGLTHLRRVGLEAVEARPLFLPCTWTRGNQSAIDFAFWYAERYGLHMDAAAENAWRALSARVECVAKGRQLCLFPHAQDSVPIRLVHKHVDVAKRGVNAHSPLYAMSSVTGVDFRVQAVVASQASTANALLEAIDSIENSDHREFAFVCHGATHRSVACCFLLAAVAYPLASVCLTTARTRRAAEEYGLFV